MAAAPTGEQRQGDTGPAPVADAGTSSACTAGAEHAAAIVRVAKRLGRPEYRSGKGKAARREDRDSDNVDMADVARDHASTSTTRTTRPWKARSRTLSVDRPRRVVLEGFDRQRRASNWSRGPCDDDDEDTVDRHRRRTSAGAVQRMYQIISDVNRAQISGDRVLGDALVSAHTTIAEMKTQW